MPGQINSANVPADYMTPFKKLRAAVTASDANAAAAAVVAAPIDMFRNMSGGANRVSVFGVRNSGTGTATVTLWGAFDGPYGTPVQVSSAAVNLNTGGLLVDFTSLLAGAYYLVIAISGTANFDLYESHSGLSYVP